MKCCWIQWGCVTSCYPTFIGSHFVLCHGVHIHWKPFCSSIHKTTGLGSKFMQTLTYSYMPHCMCFTKKGSRSKRRGVYVPTWSACRPVYICEIHQVCLCSSRSLFDVNFSGKANWPGREVQQSTRGGSREKQEAEKSLDLVHEGQRWGGQLSMVVLSVRKLFSVCESDLSFVQACHTYQQILSLVMFVRCRSRICEMSISARSRAFWITCGLWAGKYNCKRWSWTILYHKSIK